MYSGNLWPMDTVVVRLGGLFLLILCELEMERLYVSVCFLLKKFDR